MNSAKPRELFHFRKQTLLRKIVLCMHAPERIISAHSLPGSHIMLDRADECTYI